MAYFRSTRLMLPGLLLALSVGQAQPQPQPDREIPIENAQVRVVLVHRAEPLRKTRVHRHDMNRVMIYLNEGGQTVEYTEGSQRVEKIRWKAGEALWSPAAGLHTAEITSAEPARIVEIELRNVPGRDRVLTPPRLPRGASLELDNRQVRVVRYRVPGGQSRTEIEHDGPRIVTWVRGNGPEGKPVEWHEAASRRPPLRNEGQAEIEAVVVYLKL